MNIRPSVSVIRVAIAKILPSTSTEPAPLSSSTQLPSPAPLSSSTQLPTPAPLFSSTQLPKPVAENTVVDKIEIDWLADYIPYQSETILSDDIQELRMLEAEIYTLNDQSNTELGQDNPSVS